MLCWPEARRDWARCGLALYGIDPAGASTTLHPVMSARSQIIGVREIAAGERVGYGGRYVAGRATRVGLVACTAHASRSGDVPIIACRGIALKRYGFTSHLLPNPQRLLSVPQRPARLKCSLRPKTKPAKGMPSAP